MTINVPSTAVIQVKQGIGDVIWHLPFVRAIAAREPGGAVSFLTLPSTRAKELLQAEPCIGEVAYFEHHGSEVLRGFHLARLVALMRSRRLPAHLDSRPHHPPRARCPDGGHSGAFRPRRRRAALADHQWRHR